MAPRTFCLSFQVRGVFFIWYDIQVFQTDDPLCLLVWAAIIFVAGWVGGFLVGSRKSDRRFKLIMSIQLDATQPIKITAKGVDAEGNAVDLSTTDLTITAEATSGNFGEVNDDMDTFNPGEAGATGKLIGTVTINDIEYRAEVEVELVPGALAGIELEFAPVQ